MKTIIQTIRNNTVAGWFFALLIGFAYRYAYGIVKIVIFEIVKGISFGGQTPESQIIVMAVVLNTIAELVATSIAALLCVVPLVYVLRGRAKYMFLGSLIIFLAYSKRLWHFRQFSEPYAQYISLMAPMLAILVFSVATTFMLKRITTG